MIQNLKVIAIVLLLACLLPMPYWYFQLFRIYAIIVFGLVAYDYYRQNKIALSVVFGTLVLIFQPLVKIAFGRALWNIIDVVVALLLIVLLVRNRND